MNESASEIGAETSPANRDFAGPTQQTRTISGAIKTLFRAAAKTITRRDEEEKPPQPRRRSGETDKGFVAVWRTMQYRAASKIGAAARGRYAALRPAKAEPEAFAPADAYTGAGMYLADTLEWLNLWQDNASNEQWPDGDFNAKQDHSSPQP